MNILLIITAFYLGILHSFDPDHIAAMTVFSTKSNNLWDSLILGVKWGAGHFIMLFIIGIVISLFNIKLTPLFESLAEIMVGMFLIVIGWMAIKDILRIKNIHIHYHVHNKYQHLHFHSHEMDNSHRHKHSPIFVGACHGTAGTSSVLVFIPIAMISSPMMVAIYIMVFSLGTIISMVVYTILVALFCNRVLADRHGLRLSFMVASGLCSIGIGLVWITKNAVFIP